MKLCTGTTIVHYSSQSTILFNIVHNFLISFHKESARLSEQTTFLWNSCNQEVHLISENFSILQDQVLRTVWNVRNIKQLHMCLLWCSVILQFVTNIT